MAVRQDIFEYIRCVGRLRIIKLGIIKIVDIRIPNRVFNSIMNRFNSYDLLDSVGTGQPYRAYAAVQIKQDVRLF